MTVMTLPPEVYAEPELGLYPADMVKRVLRGVQEIRLAMGDVFKSVEERKEHVVFARRGKPIAVLVPIDWYRGAADKVGDPTEF